MVYHSASLDRTFAALADPTRREILRRLTTSDRTISELASRFDMSLPAVSKHVRVLERAGLAVVAREGRVRRATLKPTSMRGALEWMERYRHYWTSELDQLATYLEATEPQCPTPSPTPAAPSKSAAPFARRASASSTRGPGRRK